MDYKTLEQVFFEGILTHPSQGKRSSQPAAFVPFLEPSYYRHHEFVTAQWPQNWRGGKVQPAQLQPTIFLFVVGGWAPPPRRVVDKGFRKSDSGQPV